MGNSSRCGQGRTVVLLHGVLAASEQQPQGRSLLPGEAGLAGSGQCLMLFPIFPHSCLVWWGAVASKQHVQPCCSHALGASSGFVHPS